MAHLERLKVPYDRLAPIRIAPPLEEESTPRIYFRGGSAGLSSSSNENLLALLLLGDALADAMAPRQPIPKKYPCYRLSR